MSSPKPLPRYFYSLDALRGFAALAVVFYHWHFFYFQGTQMVPLDASRLPLFWVFWPFYEKGYKAVPLFFCLSGFIFFWLYGRKIADGAVSAREFAVLRFSRLYPLHLLTLLLVACGQYSFHSRHGSFFVFPYNDAYHFTLQLLFASEWGFQKGYSFNGPVWSVSLEILLYIAFYLVCRLRLNRWWHLVLFIVAGRLTLPLNFEIGSAVIAFFVGGLTFYAVERWDRNGLPRLAPSTLLVLTVLAWLVVPTEAARGLTSQIRLGSFPGRGLVGKAVFEVDRISYELILFPLTIATLALFEARRGTLGKRLSFLGHISYSSYLLHFPLQLGIVLIGSSFSPGSRVFSSPVTLAGFFGVLISLSLGSYSFVEKPAQAFLRARLLPRAADS